MILSLIFSIFNFKFQVKGNQKINTSKPTYFISDIHLGAKNISRNTQILYEFLSAIQHEKCTLYIVGDLFDFWFEYKYVIPRKHFHTLCRFEEFIQQGNEIHLVTGNHDFWVDTFFQNDLGIHLHTRPVETEINQKHIYIGHGDGLAKNDIGYRLLKHVFQFSLNIKLFRLIHPDLGFGLAHFCSNLSRENASLKDDSDYFNFAEIKFKEGFDFVILGHTHIPRFHQKNHNIYVNTGDWINHFSYGLLKDNKLTLEYWPLQKQKSAHDLGK